MTRSKGIHMARMGLVALVAAIVSHADWALTSGPEGGTVTALRQKSDTLWAATCSGVHISTDTGNTWRYSDLRGTYVTVLHVHNGILFAGTNSKGLRRLSGTGQWDAITQGLTATESAYGMVTWRQQMFLANGWKVFSSDDDGDSWTEVDSQPSASGISVLACYDRYLFAGGYTAGVFRSDDSGATWDSVTTGLPASYNVQGLYVADTVVFAQLQGSLYRSTSNGDTWSACTGPQGALSGHGMASIGDTVFLLNGTAVYVSGDLGATWDKCMDLVSVDESATLCIPGRVLVSGVDGIHFSRDGGATWEVPSPNIVTTYSGDLVTDGDTLLTPLYNLGIARSGDNGATWTVEGQGPIKQNLAWLDTLLLARQSSAVIYSGDRGHTWSAFSSYSGGYLSSLLVADGVIYASTYSKGVFRSSDSGATWDSVNAGLPGRDIRAFGTVAGKVFAGAEGYGICRLDGDTWIEVNDGIEVSASVRHFAAFASRDSVIVAGTDYGFSGAAVYVSDDLGVTWTVANAGVEQMGCNLLQVFDSVLVGVFNYNRLYVSGDWGLSWQAFDQGADSVRFVRFATVGDTLFAGSDGDGVWKRPLAELYAAASPTARSPRPRVAGTATAPFANMIEVFDASGRLVRRVRLSTQRVSDVVVSTALHGLKPGTYVVRTNAAGWAPRRVTRM